jgi:Nif-specific regulatory protein
MQLSEVEFMAAGDDRVSKERALFSLMLELPFEGVDEWLRRVLEALIGVVAATRGYVELYRDEGSRERKLSASFRCSSEDEAEIRAVTSRGIVAEAVASGTTVHTPMALLDARFGKQPSVVNQRLEAVLCVPFSGNTLGVLYLEGPTGGFPAADVALTEKVALFLGQVLGSLVLTEAGDTDFTRAFRGKLKVENLAGSSRALGAVFEQLVQVAGVDISVLFLGESGTGKTHLARALHASSRRAGGPFVEVNCAAIPENLVESELFGTKLGAFTGARASPGKVETADGGTLFLDEVGELPLSSQAKLLQLLSEKQYYRVGGTRLERANVRVLAATNVALEQLVGEKRFRSDLFHRLSAFVVRVPSLSERKADLGVLIDELLQRIATEHVAPLLQASSSLRTACEVREWPGNIRELRNRLEQAVLRARAEGAAVLEGRHLDVTTPPGQALTLAQATHEFQGELLRRELEAASWNVTQVAKRLDVTRQHIYNLIKTFGLKREER